MACNEQKKQNDQTRIEHERHNEINDAQIDKITVEPELHETVGADLFGEFYNNRVSFFTKDHPGLDVEGANVERVVFYYLDEELFQTKYQLNTDITPKLIRSHGKFKIRGLNLRNDYFIKRLKSRILYGNEIVSLINYYQLRWEANGDEIIYQVRRDTVSTNYTYIERLRGYKEILKSIKTSESD